MSQGIPPGYVLPTPQTAKLVGTLNIVFASLLLVYILFQIAMLFFTPALVQMASDFIKQTQAKTEQVRKGNLEKLKQLAALAKTAEEKAEIKQQQTALEKASQPTMPDMSKVTEMMKNPAYQAYVRSDFLSGLVLNVAMLISGIGLLRLKETGRRLALWTFGLKIVRLCALGIVMIIIIIPITSRMTSELMAGMAQGGAGAPQTVNFGNFAKIQAALGSVQAVLGAVFGSIWPIIGMVLLTRHGSRAACQASVAKPALLDQGLS